MNALYGFVPAALIGLFAAAGCNSGAAPGNGAGAPATDKGDLPAVHAVFRWERVDNGKNLQRADYHFGVKTCKDAGWPTKELSPQDAEKISTGEVEIWRDAHGAFGRQTYWEFELAEKRGDGRSCTFRLKETVEKGGADNREGDWSAVEMPSAAEQDSFAHMQGFKRVGASNVKGFACTRWRSPTYEICSWSGGKSLGIDDDAVEAPCTTLGFDAFLNPLPLEGKQTAGYGCNIELKSMTVSRGYLKEVDQYLQTQETGE